ncbi:hypothetical protein J6590_029484 [Homalodisca vitripennis]|nr:hypothetical protein J6590_029484 [Homalodisca vitripennis]
MQDDVAIDWRCQVMLQLRSKHRTKYSMRGSLGSRDCGGVTRSPPRHSRVGLGLQRKTLTALCNTQHKEGPSYTDISTQQWESLVYTQCDSRR